MACNYDFDKKITVITLVLNCNSSYIVVWKVVYARKHLREYSSSSKRESIIYIYIYIYIYTVPLSVIVH